MHPASSLAATALTLAALTSLTAAQSAIPASETIRYPSGFAGGGDFTAAALADFDIDGAADAVVLDGTRLVVSYMIDAMTAPTTISTWGGTPLTASDFTILHEVNPLASYGTVASVGPDGLSLSMFDSVFQTFNRLQLIEGDFVNAKQVHGCDWDNDGDQDIIALNEDRDEILVLLGDGTGVWTAGTGFSLGLTATDILPLDWEGSAALEVAVTDSAGLKIYEQGSSAPCYVRGNTADPGKIARIRNGGGDDQLAWLVEALNGSIYLTTLEAGAGPFHTILFPEPDPLSMAAGDYDGDGADDLAFTLGSNDELVVLDNPNGSGQFVSTASSLLSWNAGTTFGGQNNVAPVAFGDLDFDGKTDLLLASGASRDMFLLYNEQKAAVTLGTTTHGFQEAQTSICENDIDDGYLATQATFEDPSSTLDNFQVSTWLQDISTGVMTAQSYSNCPSVSTNGAGTYTVEVSIGGATASEILWNGTQRLHVLVRPQNSNDILVAPAIHATYTFDESDLVSGELVNTWTSSETFTITDCNSPAAGSYEGGWQGSDRVPPFPGNQRPVFGNTCETPTSTN
ncbi:MAG: VCBS repeat-containing protein [Planctomycetota bacterium]|nr:VCBS repeat-containing protein [Planctomycetota bacterium]